MIHKFYLINDPIKPVYTELTDAEYIAFQLKHLRKAKG